MFLEIVKVNNGKQRNAYLKGYKVIENPLYKRRISYLLEELSDLKVIDRVLFIYSEDIRPFLILYTHYRLIEVKYFK